MIQPLALTLSVARHRKPGQAMPAHKPTPAVVAETTGARDQRTKMGQAGPLPRQSSRKLALIAGISHTKICMLRKPKEEDTSYKTLEPAWAEKAAVA